jgi:hypothetical protein
MFIVYYLTGLSVYRIYEPILTLTKLEFLLIDYFRQSTRFYSKILRSEGPQLFFLCFFIIFLQIFLKVK